MSEKLKNFIIDQIKAFFLWGYGWERRVSPLGGPVARPGVGNVVCPEGRNAIAKGSGCRRLRKPMSRSAVVYPIAVR